MKVEAGAWTQSKWMISMGVVFIPVNMICLATYLYLLTSSHQIFAETVCSVTLTATSIVSAILMWSLCSYYSKNKTVGAKKTADIISYAWITILVLIGIFYLFGKGQQISSNGNEWGIIGFAILQTGYA